ncbi:laccase 2 [Fusarium mundagurra]|uniref:Laccase 2 n=1 Tax=Fusarium mundagurra TaxID=1567541 RepID=A0A8H5YIB9_9HYPO|nr:laccase 2 [Fusarium mundagurra]
MVRSRRIVQSSLHPMAPIHQMEDFICKYPELGNEWKSCSTPENRHCWLKSFDGHNFSIHTDYETMYPPGVLREYWLVVDNKTINGDGIDNPYGKVFNQTYPGPWIKACWGDLIRVHVTNKLRYNGTTVHWHGLSHYSLQYADGLAGPITIFGPSSGHYDEAKDPILITDWNHRRNFAGSFPRERYNITVTKGKKYLLRIINTSVDTTFLFGIDNHYFEVMSSDFVPIHPYTVGHILVEIGQRYHIVPHAKPRNDTKFPASDNGNYWVRTVAADGCKGFEDGNEPDERQGILRYEPVSTENLKPVLPWSIPPVKLHERDRSKNLELGIEKVKDRPHAGDKFSWWAFGERPLWLDFSKPTITLLEGTKEWPDDYVIVPAENRDGWVYLVITAPSLDRIGTNKTFRSLAHPLHLHGHDFALLAQGTNSSQINDPTTHGLALQIMEREEDLRKIMTPEKLKQVNDGCKKWKDWYGDQKNNWNPVGVFQDDSGV